MANATASLTMEAAADTGASVIYVPVKGSTSIYKGTIVSQNSSGYVLPYSASGASYAIGVAQHDADNSAGSDGGKKVAVEVRRIYCFANGAGGDAFAETSLIGAPVYASDDHTVADNSNSAARKCIGSFQGFESDGKVRVLIDPAFGFIVNALATLTDTPASADALRDNIVAQML
jgi:hypothetical protein